MIPVFRTRDLVRMAITAYAPVAVSLVVVVVGILALVSHDTTYTDASGAKCTSFVVGAHEVDICHN